ncbi:uncharacterized protein LOC114292087 [Camellia sinensis]|uniref:uncharacterized protein LOC114292087 n=1 Tax=Camellia sinensis TaxID=4442 RepID=UPI001035992D|nr:uncharacterized protein LOC114292087 [Camellia sinensis]
METVGLSGGMDLIAVIRASGRISHARGLNVPSSGIVGEQFIEKIRRGWRLPDMMFATKCSLSDACNTIAKQLENVYSSIAATKRHLSSKIDHVDRTLDESAELTAATREEVSELRGEIQVICVDVQPVHHVVRTLETKLVE